MTPWSRRSCTRRLVAITSWAILSMMRTFHVGMGATAGADELPFATCGWFSVSSDVSAATCASRSVVILVSACRALTPALRSVNTSPWG